MKNFLYTAALVIMLTSIYSCNNSSRKDHPDTKAKETDFAKLVTEWNDAHNSKNIEVFKKLYADDVVFYQTDLNKNKCVEKKSMLLKKYSDFRQTIEGKIKIEYISDTEVKCSFVKKSKWNGETKEYPSYLIFIKVGKDWKIGTEGDSVTDENLKSTNSSTSEKVNIVFGKEKETMWLKYPKFHKNQTEDSFGECDGPCDCYIQFSDPAIPAIKLENCIGGTPVNEGDLNNDGFDEIGILPSWWTSCWHEYKVYTYKNGQWQYLVDPITTHCDQWEEGVDAISKDKSKPGYVTIRYSEFTDEGIEIKTKSVKLK